MCATMHQWKEHFPHEKEGQMLFVFLLPSFQYASCRNPWRAMAHIFLISFNLSGHMSFSKAKVASTGVHTLGFGPPSPYRSGCFLYISSQSIVSSSDYLGCLVGWCCVAHRLCSLMVFFFHFHGLLICILLLVWGRFLSYQVSVMASLHFLEG